VLEEVPALASACAGWKGLSQQLTLSVFPVPEPIRTIDIGICLCMLHKSPVPRPVLQKVPSKIPKGFTDINKLSVLTALPTK
jgi:hypothetical protein